MRRTAKNAGAAGELRLHCFSRRPATRLPAARDRDAPATPVTPAAYPRGKTRTPPPREPRDRAPPAHRALPPSRSQGARGHTGLPLRRGHPRRPPRRHRRPACGHRREGARPRHRPGRTDPAPRPRRPAPRHPPPAAHTGSGRTPRPSGDLLALRHPGGPGRSRPGPLGGRGHPARPAAPHPAPAALPEMRGPAKAAHAVARLRAAGPHPAVAPVLGAWHALPAWARAEAPMPDVTTLCHGDLHLGQLVRHPAPDGPWRLIDVDDLGVGVPAWDLARPAAWYACGLLPPEEWTRFLAAYRARAGPPSPRTATPGTPSTSRRAHSPCRPRHARSRSRSRRGGRWTRSSSAWSTPVPEWVPSPRS